MVVVPGSEGDFGVLPGHAPLISTVRPGVLEVFQGNKVEQRIFVAGGFAEVTPERCTVLADEAVPFEEVTAEQLAERERAAERDVTDAGDRRRKGRRREGPGRRQGPAPGPGLLRQPLKSRLISARTRNDPRPTYCRPGRPLALRFATRLALGYRPWELDTRHRSPGTASTLRRSIRRSCATSRRGHGGAQRRRLRHLLEPRLRRRSRVHRGRRHLGEGRGPARHGARPLGAACRSDAGTSTAAFARFRAGYKLPLDATASVRGSQAGEMMARCIVETGTSSYYSALEDATDEPVLKQICGQDRGRRVPPLQAVLRPSAPLPGARPAEPLGPAAHRLGPHGRERGRRARLRLLRGQRARGRGLRPQAQHAGLCPARLSALSPASTSSAPWPWC